MSEHSFSVSYLLIEGPSWYDAEFFGKWLLAATEAQRLSEEAVNTDSEFSAKTERLEFGRREPFGGYATTLIRCLTMTGCTAVIDTDTDLAQGVAMMAHMGFFALTGERYQMVLPSPLNSEVVRASALTILEAYTGYCMPVQKIMRTMPWAIAKDLQQKLEQMDQVQRVADRELLLLDEQRSRWSVDHIWHAQRHSPYSACTLH
jgi:hypothetical protein